MKREHRFSPSSAFKKTLSLVLCLAMLVTAIPFSALASVEWPETSFEEEATGPDENEEETKKVIKSITAKIDGDTFSYEPKNGEMGVDELEEFSNSDAALAMEAKLQTNGEEEIEYAAFSVEELVKIVDFKRSSPSNKAQSFTDKDGKQHIYYGASNYSTLFDANHDLICDICGYCLDGCTDGTLKTYTEDDLKTHGESIRTKVEYEYTYEITHEDGTTETKTEKGEYWEYKSYYVDGDGFCDKCGNKMHDNLEFATDDPHSYADGKCDGCGTCVGGHTDKDNDGKCDFCKKCVDGCFDVKGASSCTVCGECIECVDKTGAKDAAGKDIPDGKCDVCGKCIECVDETGAKDAEGKDIPDGKCDVCGKVICDSHVDFDGDNVCDKCGRCVEHSFSDGICDNCGFCFGKDCVPGEDGKCTVCKNPLPSSTCIHSDKLGNESCNDCGKPFCSHMSLAEITRNYQWFAGAYGYLASLSEDGTAPEGCDEAWFESLKAFVTAKDEDETGDADGIHSVLNMRKEIKSCSVLDEALVVFKDTILALDAAKVNASSLVGTLKTENNASVIDRTNSYYAEVNGEGSTFNEYVKAYNACKYDESKAYFREFSNISGYKNSCNEKINSIAATLLDEQLKKVYGSYNGGKITVNEKNLSEMKLYVKSVEEVLLAHLYGVDYSTESLVSSANAIWNGSQTLGSKSAKDQRIIKFILLEKIRSEINKLREAAFTNYKQTTYDKNGSTYYAKREAASDDIARDENNDSHDVYVYDETIQKIINALDSYCSSGEFVDLLGLTKENDVPDRDEDGVVGIYDFIMYILIDKVLTGDILNMLVSSIFPTVINFVEVELPKMLDKAYYGVKYNGNGEYEVNFTEMISGLLKNEAKWNGTLSELFTRAFIGDSWVKLYVDGHGPYEDANSNTFAKLFSDAGFSFYPYQVAQKLSEADSSKYSKIIRKLNSAGKDWTSLVGSDLSGMVDFDWGIESFGDFKEALASVLSCFGPILEILFADELNVSDVMSFKRIGAVYGDINLLWSIFLTLDLTLGLDIDFESFNLYQDVIVPIFEALGVSNFNYGKNYKFTNISYSNRKSDYGNAKEVVDKILDPVMVLVEQVSSHPLQKLLGILPNIALFLENGLELDLLDIETSVDALIDIDFNFSWESILFSCMKSIIDSVMEHWYDWLRPSKYVQWLTKTALFLLLQPVFKLVFDTVLDTISVTTMLNLGIEFDVSSLLNGVFENLVGGVDNVFNSIAGVFGGEYRPDPNRKINSPKVELKNIIKNLNIKNLIDMFITEETLGFNPNNLTSIINHFMKNTYKKGTDEPLFNIDTSLIDFDELSSLGVLSKKTGTIREEKYYERFENLSKGQYYFVNADTSDVFYYLLKTVVGLMGDDDSLNSILSMVGMSYDSLKESISAIKMEGIKLEKAIANDIVTDGKLDLDKIRKNIDENDILVILAELIAPENDYPTAEINWKSSVTMTGESSSYSEIPYLEYDNEWTKAFAETAVDGIDDVANSLVEMLGLDLGEAKTVSQWLKNTVDGVLDGDILSVIIKTLSGFGSITKEDISTLEKKLIGIDLTQWGNDYRYLFKADAKVPTNKNFPDLTGKANGDGTYTWTFGGKEVKDYKDVLSALRYLISPLSEVLDAILAGKDLKALKYNKNTASTGSVVTVKGTQGYSLAMIPLLETLGVDEASILTQSEFNFYPGGSVEALTYSLNLLIEKVYSIIESEHPVKEFMQLIVQLLYFISSDGLGAVANDIAHPIMVLLDIVRPVVNLDIDAIINDLVCEMTYKIGGYSSADHMEKALELRNAKLSIKNLSLESLMKLAGVIVSATKNGSRKFLDLQTVTAAAIDDLAFLRTEKTSKALDENGNAKKYYAVTISGADSFTSLVSFFLEAAIYSNNAEIIDAFVKTDGLVETLSKAVLGLPVEENLGFDWAYILSDKATAAEKKALIKKIKEEGGVLCGDYRKQDIKYLETYDKNNWTEGTADYLANYLNEMISTVLADMDSEYKNFGELLTGLANGYLTDETVDKIVFMIGELLNKDELSKFKDLIFWADGFLNVDASVYDANNSVVKGKKVIYYKSVYDENGNLVDLGEPTGLVRRTVKDSESFALALSDIVAPIERILSWLLLDGTLEYFNTTGSVKSRRENLVTVSGANGYATGVLPILEALGCKNLKSADEYSKDDVGTLMADIFTSLIERVTDIISDGDSGAAVNKIIDLLPNLIYFVNSDGFTLAVNNIAAPANVLLEILSEKSGKEISLSTLSKLPLDDLSFKNIFKVVEDMLGIKVNEYITNLFENFTLGKICYNSASLCDFDTYYMTYSNEEDRAEFITIMLSVGLEILEDPANKEGLTKLLGEDMYQGVINVMNLWKFEFEMQDFSWIFTEYANTGTVLSALTMSEIFGNVGYGHLWTREKALALVNNLNSFVDDMIYLLGLTINGKKIVNFSDLVHQLVGGLIYSQDLIKFIIGIISSFKPLLEKYDPQGTIAGFVKELLEFDVHAWDKYSGDYDWGFEDGDREGFENALVEVLSPVSRIIQWLFCDRDYAFFIDADGISTENKQGSTDQIVIYGADGYAFGIVPILEAFNVPNIVKPEDYSKEAAKDKNAALRNLVSPLLDLVDEIMDNTPKEIFELLPSVIYFINSNGLDTCFRNILHAAYRIFDAVEPLIGKIDPYEILGIDLETINFEFLFNKALDMINEKTGFRFTTMAADAIAELTQGEVVSFTSLNGRQAYTMRYSGVYDYADMLTILIRLILRFLSLDGNTKVLMDIMQQKFQMSAEDYEMVYSVLQTFAKWSASNTNLQVVMTSIYYYVFGSAIASDKGVEAYDKVNGKWRNVVYKLVNIDNPIAQEVLKELLKAADDNVGDIISSDGIAANGLIKFFMAIYNWIMKIINSIKSIFTRR